MLFPDFSKLTMVCAYSHLCIFTIFMSAVPVARTRGQPCSFVCRYENGLYTIGDKNTPPGAPKLVFNTTRRDVLVDNGRVIARCPLCQSKPASTLTWFFNGKPLDVKTKRIQKTSLSCEENLDIRITGRQDEGDYTCVARNKFGTANATTRVFVIGLSAKRSLNLKLKLDGSIKERNVRIGSSINITCSVVHAKCTTMTWSWDKNGQPFTSRGPGKRIEWTKNYSVNERNLTQCYETLRIRNITAEDAGEYGCVGYMLFGFRLRKAETSVSINAVVCFRGYYCPSNYKMVKRCPYGTFSMYENATSVKHCRPCPTHSRNETLLHMRAKGLQDAADVFHQNCPSFIETGSRKASGLSTGEILGVSISVVAVVLTALLALRGWRGYKRLIHNPHKDIEIEIPDIPRTNDVFICYSSRNRQWVHDTLLANLKAQDFRTFIDVIDFEVGLPIHENIITGIYGSRKTLFVLSRDSLKSFYARMELRQALIAGMSGHDHQVIVILFEKLKVPAEISQVVYLDWTDEKNREQFWEKLYRAIRKENVVG